MDCQLSTGKGIYGWFCLQKIAVFSLNLLCHGKAYERYDCMLLDDMVWEMVLCLLALSYSKRVKVLEQGGITI